MASPWALPVKLTVRSFEIPPLNAYSDESVAAPDCRTVGVRSGSGLISYQRTSEPAPPATAWHTQTAVFPKVGSGPDTEWVRRPSRVSTWLLVFFCGAFGGEVNVATVTECGAERTGISGSPVLGLSAYSVS